MNFAKFFFLAQVPKFLIKYVFFIEAMNHFFILIIIKFGLDSSRQQKSAAHKLLFNLFIIQHLCHPAPNTTPSKQEGPRSTDDPMPLSVPTCCVITHQSAPPL